LEQPGDGHLTVEEISQILGGGGSAEQQRHAHSCGICQQVMGMFEKEEARLRALGQGRPGPAGPECPSAEEWVRLAAGQIPEARALEWMAHASQCDGCGFVLRSAIRDLTPEVSLEEQQTLGDLKSTRAEWQRDMALMMAERTQRVAPIPIPLGRRWLARAATVVLIAGASAGVIWLFWPESPARLLAKAYTEQRTFDLRLPDAGHAPVRVQKGSHGSAFSRPTALIEAEARIKRELSKRPDDPKWLRLQAHAEMMEQQYEAAIATLSRALEAKPDDPELLADLGGAYALKAETGDRAVDYSTAIEFLSRSLRANPKMPRVIFNRALVHEEMFLYDAAASDWHRYLDLDPKGSWADEARQRLSALEQKKSP
jgi:tetratricopeptide (TPR) repeat protein